MLGLVRSLLALSLLLTLFFNADSTLFPNAFISSLNSNDLSIKFNLFYIFRDNLWISRIVAILILAVVISGFYPRFTGVLHWYIVFSYFNANYITEGGDRLMVIATLLLVPVTILDNRKNHWQRSVFQSPASLLAANFFVLLINANTAVLYVYTAVDKIIKNEFWREGTAVYYFFNNVLYGAPDYLLSSLNSILRVEGIAFVMNWAVLLFEIFLGCAMFFSAKFKRKLFVPAVLFHLSIAYLFGLISFFIVMCGLLILYLLPLEKKLFEK